MEDLKEMLQVLEEENQKAQITVMLPGVIASGYVGSVEQLKTMYAEDHRESPGDFAYEIGAAGFQEILAPNEEKFCMIRVECEPGNLLIPLFLFRFDALLGWSPTKAFKRQA